MKARLSSEAGQYEEQQIKEPSAGELESLRGASLTDVTPRTREHLLEVWARLENGRESTHQFAKVVFDFTPPSVGEITVKDENGETIEGSNTNSGTVQVCGETEPGAQVQISNTDAEGESVGTCEGLAQDDGSYCVSCDLAEGQNQLYVTVIDRARNSSAMNEDEESRGRSRLLNVDSAGPDVVFISPRPNAWVDPGEVDVRVQVWITSTAWRASPAVSARPKALRSPNSRSRVNPIFTAVRSRFPTKAITLCSGLSPPITWGTSLARLSIFRRRGPCS